MSSINGYASLSGSLSTQITEVVESRDYNELENIPTINGHLVKGDLTTSDLGIERGYDASVDPENEEHLVLRT